MQKKEVTFRSGGRKEAVVALLIEVGSASKGPTETVTSVLHSNATRRQPSQKMYSAGKSELSKDTAITDSDDKKPSTCTLTCTSQTQAEAKRQKTHQLTSRPLDTALFSRTPTLNSLPKYTNIYTHIHTPGTHTHLSHTYLSFSLTHTHSFLRHKINQVFLITREFLS